MKTIYKYPLTHGHKTVIVMPEKAEILCIQVDGKNGRPTIWAKVEESDIAPQINLEQRTFINYCTGEEFTDDPKLIYIGTFQVDGGAFVGHVFEEI